MNLVFQPYPLPSVHKRRELNRVGTGRLPTDTVTVTGTASKKIHDAVAVTWKIGQKATVPTGWWPILLLNPSQISSDARIIVKIFPIISVVNSCTLRIHNKRKIKSKVHYCRGRDVYSTKVRTRLNRVHNMISGFLPRCSYILNRNSTVLLKIIQKSQYW
jgi:hypothetical protein